MKKFEESSARQKDELLELFKEWAVLHGLTMRVKTDLESFSIAAFSLFPSPIEKDAFDKAVSVQATLNALLHRLAYDPDFIQQALSKTIEHDEFTRRLYEIYTIVRKEGSAQSLSCGLFRCDYLPDRDGSLKQVEMNTIASSMAGLTSRVELAHRFILRTMQLEDHLENLPKNSCLTDLARGLVEAWKIFNVERSVILFVVEEVTINICDQRLLELEISRLNRQTKVVRRSFSQLINEARLGPNMELIVDGLQVGVVYFRCGYAPEQYTEEAWLVRLTIERSNAIKCPSIQYHLVGTKKVQQVLCEEGVLEKYIENTDSVRLIRAMFANIYPLDKSEAGEKAYRLAMTEPTRFVLKPQREGGGNNVYGDDIPSHLTGMSRDEASAWILMDIIEPVASRNVLLRPASTPPARIVSELGIYGVIIGNEKEILLNEASGHCLRSKVSTAQEGGVAAGFGALDSPYLV